MGVCGSLSSNVFVRGDVGRPLCCCFFFFNDTATTEIYTLSLHDALPISCAARICAASSWGSSGWASDPDSTAPRDRKSTRLNSSHQIISYAVFCLKKKKQSRHLPHPHHQLHLTLSDSRLRLPQDAWSACS